MTEKTLIRRIVIIAVFLLLAAGLWILRSWNLEIGDGLFCCKQTVGEQAYAVTLSRSLVSYWLYRVMFFTLHPLLNWWVEDIIALSSCAAGLVFFYSLYRLASASASSMIDFWALILFPSTTLVLQIFCGHIEFYPWTCALLMVFTWCSWESIFRKRPFWHASLALTLAGAFHSSGVFYFPALLLLPILQKQQDNLPTVMKNDWGKAAWFFALFIAAALLHRKPTQWFYVGLLFAGGWAYWQFCPARWRQELSAWWLVLIPWLGLFALRAVLGLRAEPLLEHLPPLGEPYDHGAYLYEAFSWDHFHDKFLYHQWLTPFGLFVFLVAVLWGWRRIKTNGWLLFLANFSFWALLWSTLFYPQLRERDWDLFASMAIPLNLFAVYIGYTWLSRTTFHALAGVAVVVHLMISLPIILRNSDLLEHRGYVTVEYAPEPVATTAYIRSLQLGTTPLKQENIRTGKAEIRMVPLERGYASWYEEIVLERGKTYRFDPQLQKADHLIPPVETEQESPDQ